MPENIPDERHVETMLALSKAARERFNVRNETEWKVCFGLWTAFGVATGFVVSTSSWKPGLTETYLIWLSVAVICAAFYWWTINRRQFDANDSYTSYYWESAIEQAINAPLETKLQPKTGKAPWSEKTPWIRFGGKDKEASDKDKEAGDKAPKLPPFDLFHPGFVGEIAVTTVLAILLCGAVQSKQSQQPTEKTSVNINTKDSNSVDLKIAPK